MPTSCLCKFYLLTWIVFNSRLDNHILEVLNVNTTFVHIPLGSIHTDKHLNDKIVVFQSLIKMWSLRAGICIMNGPISHLTHPLRVSKYFYLNYNITFNTLPEAVFSALHSPFTS